MTENRTIGWENIFLLVGVSFILQVFADEGEGDNEGVFDRIGGEVEGGGNLGDLHAFIPAHLIDPSALEGQLANGFGDQPVDFFKMDNVEGRLIFSGGGIGFSKIGEPVLPAAFFL